jgi:uncharacterized protein YjiS (DUF1127 family)
MMEESLRREHRRSSFVHRLDEHRRPARLPRMVYPSSVVFSDRAQPPLWASPEAPLAALHRIATAIRVRRERDRSRQQLRELNDHLLKDIGLRRGDLGFEAPKPPWHRD